MIISNEKKEKKIIILIITKFLINKRMKVTMTIINLIFKDKTFNELKNKKPEKADVILEINTELKESTLTFPTKTTLVDRRTAQRQAESICKVGYLMKTGQRIGQGSKLEIKNSKDIDENLTRPANVFRQHL